MEKASKERAQIGAVMANVRAKFTAARYCEVCYMAKPTKVNVRTLPSGQNTYTALCDGCNQRAGRPLPGNKRVNIAEMNARIRAIEGDPR